MFRLDRTRIALPLLLLVSMLPSLVLGQSDSPMLDLSLRSQSETSPGSGRFHLMHRDEQWNPKETALIVCDVWDLHHCLKAVRRLEEFAPRLNEVVKAAREQGVTIIHSPSDCMAAYADHPARSRAEQAPGAEYQPPMIDQWCSRIPSEERGVYPIDQSDGGEDDNPVEHQEWAAKLKAMGRNPGTPWKKQHDKIEIDTSQDYITDKGVEVWNILSERGIKNVILTGVHVNMCVLGRPFGLRQMARNGKNVVLMRDMTDAMYNPERWPYVSHYTGNDLIISHIERFICPTITSDQLLGGEPFQFSKDTRPHLVMVIAEDPYHTQESLPQFAANHLGKQFRVTTLFAKENDRNSIPGLSALRDADLLLLSVRRRVLPEGDMAILREYVYSGKPVIGLRTSSHAFSLRDGSPPDGYADWPSFDADVFGGNYHGSYPDELRSTVQLAPSDTTPAIVRGLDEAEFVQGGHMYKVSPLANGAQVLLTGQVDGHPAEPVAWTFKRADDGKSVYIALGHPEDFQQPLFQHLLLNTIHWSAGLEIPMDWQASSGVQNHWEIVDVPLQGKSADNGAGWYRCVVHLPQSWKEDGTLTLGQLDQESGIRKAFLNGTPLKSTTEKVWTIPKDAVVGDDFNLLVVQSQQGLRSAPSVDSSTAGKLLLAGRWQYHRSIDQDLSQIPLPAKFGGGADIVFSLADSLYVPRPLTRPGEFTPGIEGPACDVDGNVYAVNFAEQGTIGRVSPQGAGEVFVTLPEGSTGNGIRFLDRETFYVADYTGHNILKVNLDSRKVTVHAHNSAMNQPNDIAIMDDGTLFASDPNWPESTGQLWRIDPDGTTTLLAKDLGTANGIEVSPDGQTLYVNESAQRNIWAFTITPEKSLTSKRLLKKFDDFGFDGMRCDVDGNLYVTRYGKGTVVKLSPEGKILREIPVLGSRPSNLCFGGPDGRTIYVTEVESQRLVQFRVDRPGRAFVK